MTGLRILFQGTRPSDDDVEVVEDYSMLFEDVDADMECDMEDGSKKFVSELEPGDQTIYEDEDGYTHHLVVVDVDYSATVEAPVEPLDEEPEEFYTPDDVEDGTLDISINSDNKSSVSVSSYEPPGKWETPGGDDTPYIDNSDTKQLSTIDTPAVSEAINDLKLGNFSGELSPAFMQDVELSLVRLARNADNLSDPEKRVDSPLNIVVDAVTICTLYERLEGIMRNARYRDMTYDMLARLGKSTQILTTLGEKFGLEVDGEAVEGTVDFSKWNVDKLRRLATMVYTYATSVTERDAAKDQLHALYDENQKSLEEARSRIIALTEQRTEDATVAEERINEVRKQVERARMQLAAFKDQPTYVVAKVDPTTGIPVKYYKWIDEGHIKAVNNFQDGTTYPVFTQAEYFRATIVRGIQARAGLHGTHGAGTHRRTSFKVSEKTRADCKNVVVMQFNLKQVSRGDM